MKTCPNAALEIIIGLSPLHLYIKRVAGSRAISLRAINQIKINNGRKGHCNIYTKLGMAEEVIQLSDLIVKTIDCRRNFYIIIPKKETISNVISSLPRHASIWYTDGSKTDKGTGAGVVGPGFQLSLSLGKAPTVFQAEILAIEICALQCINKRYKGVEIYIISDSQASLVALGASVFNSQLTWSCYHNLKTLGSENKVTLLWSPGHSGTQGNEMADCRAKAGANNTFTGPEPSIAFSKSHLRRCITAWEQKKRKRTGYPQRG